MPKFSEANGQQKWDLPQLYSKLTQPQRRSVREQYVTEQNGLCLHCKTPLDEQPKHKYVIDWNLFPNGFLNNPVHLHHCHKTDRTLGAVHAYCNAVLWQWFGE